MPLTAIPIAAPTIPSSAKGVSITLFAPNSFCSPSVALNMQTFNPTSSPMTITFLSLLSSCLNPIVTAWTMFATAILTQYILHLLYLLWSHLSINIFEHVFRVRILYFLEFRHRILDFLLRLFKHFCLVSVIQ